MASTLPDSRTARRPPAQVLSPIPSVLIPPAYEQQRSQA